ncbi:Potassium channel domain-containing protein [Caenorhabditis elegans]|uniref:Potassium channel domain-containing protein n=1 Tax=Caenorhabditis elegans TaxID=6239 RepID=B0M0M8_CAEEL|nr:Potassium channel domain-containing protein [Caenorhabditis elegans]CAP72374.1 Potassium channel domain-containing protein [Caenorhabditis elegans]|eukprot:NP_001122984.1 TWiK family of potassium channels [Caenorhabditis elegans]
MLNPMYMNHRASTPNPQVSYQPSTSSFQRHHRPSSPGISLGPPSSPPSLYNLQQIASATGVDQQNNDVEELSAERLNLYLDKEEGEIENLEEEIDETTEKKWWLRTKRWFRLALPHFGLVLLSIGYTLIGALCFHHYEKPYEQQLRNETSRRIGELKNRVMDQLWRMSNNGTAYSTWRQTANDGMDELIRDVFWDYTRNYMTPDDVIYGDGPIKWSFMSSIFFSWTAITTIGYGHIVPRTDEGRVAIIFYALLGIPLILVTIADIGRFLATYIIKLHHGYMAVMSFVTNSCLKCIKWACCWIRLPRRHIPMPTLELLQRTQKLYPNNNNPTVAATAASAGGGTGRRKKQQRDNVSDAGTFDNISEINDGSEGGENENEGEEEEQIQFDPSNHEKRVSVLFILLIMLGYVAGGAYIVRWWEEWTFFEAFYFCFVTVTTIGFGDIVPANVDWLPATLAYIVFGLIITTMCIDLVGSEYIRDIHFYGRSLGRQFMTIGGKVVHLGEVFGYVAFLQKNYGLTAEQLTKLSQLPEEYLLDCLINGRQPDLNWIGGRPYVPPDIYYFKWIEHPRTLSFASDRVLQSMESLDLNTSRCSTARTLTPREYYQKILFQYCKQLQPEEPIADIDN